jgi:hypothetical protein
MNELCDQISKYVHEMNDVEHAIVLLQLRLLGIKSRHDLMQDIITKFTSNLKLKNVELIAISMFSEFLRLEKDLYSKYLMIETLPILNEKVTTIDNPVDFYYLVSCLNNVHSVLSNDAMETYKAKIEDLLDREIINSDNTRVIFRTLNFLNYPHWSFSNTALIQRLLLVLKKSTHKMNKQELLQTNRAVQVQQEPANLIPLLRDRAHALLKETKNVELLQILCMYCTPDDRIKYVKMLRNEVLTFQTTLGPSSDMLNTFFKILRLLRVSDLELCDCFWTKIVNKIFSLPEPELKHRLVKYFNRYMNFNNNLGGNNNLIISKSFI